MDELVGLSEAILQPKLERSIGVERTVQIKQYEPMKVSAYLSRIPLEVWSEEGNIESLYQLLLVQVLNVYMIDQELRKELSVVDAKEYLKELENELMTRLTSNGILNVNIDVVVEENNGN